MPGIVHRAADTWGRESWPEIVALLTLPLLAAAWLMPADRGAGGAIRAWSAGSSAPASPSRADEAGGTGGRPAAVRAGEPA
jgi:hypothetical protein